MHAMLCDVMLGFFPRVPTGTKGSRSSLLGGGDKRVLCKALVLETPISAVIFFVAILRKNVKFRLFLRFASCFCVFTPYQWRESAQNLLLVLVVHFFSRFTHVDFVPYFSGFFGDIAPPDEAKTIFCRYLRHFWAAAWRPRKKMRFHYIYIYIYIYQKRIVEAKNLRLVVAANGA